MAQGLDQERSNEGKGKEAGGAASGAANDAVPTMTLPSRRPSSKSSRKPMTNEEGVADAGRHVLIRWLLRAAETVTKPRGNIGTRRRESGSRESSRLESRFSQSFV